MKILQTYSTYTPKVEQLERDESPSPPEKASCFQWVNNPSYEDPISPIDKKKNSTNENKYANTQAKEPAQTDQVGKIEQAANSLKPNVHEGPVTLLNHEERKSALERADNKKSEVYQIDLKNDKISSHFFITRLGGYSEFYHLQNNQISLLGFMSCKGRLLHNNISPYSLQIYIPKQTIHALFEETIGLVANFCRDNQKNNIPTLGFSCNNSNYLEECARLQHNANEPFAITIHFKYAVNSIKKIEANLANLRNDLYDNLQKFFRNQGTKNSSSNFADFDNKKKNKGIKYTIGTTPYKKKESNDEEDGNVFINKNYNEEIKVEIKKLNTMEGANLYNNSNEVPFDVDEVYTQLNAQISNYVKATPNLDKTQKQALLSRENQSLLEYLKSQLRELSKQHNYSLYSEFLESWEKHINNALKNHNLNNFHRYVLPILLKYEELKNQCQALEKACTDMQKIINTELESLKSTNASNEKNIRNSENKQEKRTSYLEEIKAQKIAVEIYIKKLEQLMRDTFYPTGLTELRNNIIKNTHESNEHKYKELGYRENSPDCVIY